MCLILTSTYSLLIYSSKVLVKKVGVSELCEAFFNSPVCEKLLILDLYVIRHTKENKTELEPVSFSYFFRNFIKKIKCSGQAIIFMILRPLWYLCIGTKLMKLFCLHCFWEKPLREK